MLDTVLVVYAAVHMRNVRQDTKKNLIYYLTCVFPSFSFSSCSIIHVMRLPIKNNTYRMCIEEEEDEEVTIIRHVCI